MLCLTDAICGEGKGKRVNVFLSGCLSICSAGGAFLCAKGFYHCHITAIDQHVEVLSPHIIAIDQHVEVLSLPYICNRSTRRGFITTYHCHRSTRRGCITTYLCHISTRGGFITPYHCHSSITSHRKYNNPHLPGPHFRLTIT